MKRDFETLLAIGFLMTIALLLSNGMTSYMNVDSLMENDEWVSHTYEVLASVESVHSILKDVEIGQRGYLLTGEETFLQPYLASKARLDGEVENLRTLTSDNLSQQDRLALLKEKIQDRVVLAEKSISLHKAGRLVDALQIVQSGHGTKIMDEIDHQVEGIKEEEERLLKIRIAQSRTSALVAKGTLLAATVVGIGLVGLVYFLGRRHFEERHKAVQQASAINEELERRVVLRTQELEERNLALRFEEKRYRSLVAATTAIVWNTPPSGELEGEQPGWSAYTGQTDDQLRGWGWLEAIHPDDRPHTARVWSTSHASQSMYLVEHRLRRHDGVYRYMQARAVPVTDDTGVLREWIGIHADIDDRTRAEVALREAKDAADAANRAKSNFLANMSHEIRTPMNGMIGMLGLLLDTKLTDRQREMGEVARASSENLLLIINDILDYSKIEAGKLDIEPVSFDLRQSIEEMAAMMAVQADKIGVDILVHYPPDAPCQVVGDAGRIRQVLTNLVGNAVKFTDKGYVLIELEPQTSADGTSLFRFSVKDTGIGIPADKIDSVFGRFTQADETTTRRFGGTGLGLAIGKQLVELMKGTIGVTSTPGEGSTFWFILPLPLDPNGPPLPVAKADLAGVHVLVVDDNEVNGRILHEQITAWGMRNGYCASAADALVRLRAAQAAGDPYQIALLDYHMPDMNGEQLAMRIKDDAALRDILLVMLSSADLLSGKSLTGLFNGYLVKPVRQSHLYEFLATAWATKLASRSAPAVSSSTAPKLPYSSRPASVRHARVLVVDDNAVNQKVARMMLETKGCRVDVAGNGREAIEMIQMLPFDVVFMDCEMPVLDGFAATAEIRRHEDGGRRMNIIAMTARAIQGDRERCLQAGMDDYISKPVRAEALEAILERWAPCDSPPAENGVPESTPSQAAVDPAVLANLKSMAQATDPALYEQIVQSFLQDSRKGIADFRRASDGDADSLRKTAHAIKGMCSSVGAEGMRAICQELEALGETGSVVGAGPLIDALVNEFQRAESELSSPRKVPLS